MLISIDWNCLCCGVLSSKWQRSCQYGQEEDKCHTYYWGCSSSAKIPHACGDGRCHICWCCSTWPGNFKFGYDVCVIGGMWYGKSQYWFVIVIGVTIIWFVLFVSVWNFLSNDKYDWFALNSFPLIYWWWLLYDLLISWP